MQWIFMIFLTKSFLQGSFILNISTPNTHPAIHQHPNSHTHQTKNVKIVQAITKKIVANPMPSQIFVGS